MANEVFKLGDEKVRIRVQPNGEAFIQITSSFIGDVQPHELRALANAIEQEQNKKRLAE